MNPDNPQPAPTPLTAEAIAAAVRAAMPQQQQVQQPIDPAQIEKMLNRFNYGPEIDTILFNPQSTSEQRIAAFNQVLRGVITEATTISRFQGEHLGSLLMEHFDEPIGYAREYGQKQLFEQLYENAPGLKPFDGMVRQLSSALAKDPGFPRGMKERVDFLRDRLANTIKQSAPNFDPVKGFDPATTPPGTQNPMSQFGAQPPPGAANPPAPVPGAPRIPAGSSGGAGGGTGNPNFSEPQNVEGGITADRPWGF